MKELERVWALRCVRAVQSWNRKFETDLVCCSFDHDRQPPRFEVRILYLALSGMPELPFRSVRCCDLERDVPPASSVGKIPDSSHPGLMTALPEDYRNLSIERVECSVVLLKPSVSICQKI